MYGVWGLEVYGGGGLGEVRVFLLQVNYSAILLCLYHLSFEYKVGRGLCQPYLALSHQAGLAGGYTHELYQISIPIRPV